MYVYILYNLKPTFNWMSKCRSAIFSRILPCAADNTRPDITRHPSERWRFDPVINLICRINQTSGWDQVFSLWNSNTHSDTIVWHQEYWLSRKSCPFNKLYSIYMKMERLCGHSVYSLQLHLDLTKHRFIFIISIIIVILLACVLYCMIRNTVKIYTFLRNETGMT